MHIWNINHAIKHRLLLFYECCENRPCYFFRTSFCVGEHSSRNITIVSLETVYELSRSLLALYQL